jgi:trehalose-6-phosphate synthase
MPPSRIELAALLVVCDVALCTPLADSHLLLPYQLLAAKSAIKKPAVLVLSEVGFA